MSSSKRMAKRIISAILTVMMLMSMVTIGIASTSAATVELAQTGATPSTLYLKPGSYWNVDGAEFRAWIWGSSTESDKWINFTDTDGDGTFEAALSSAYTDIIFFRSEPGKTEWNGEWGRIQTTIPTDGKNCYTLSSYSSGSWGTYTPPTPAEPGDDSAWNLMGITDWTTGDKMQYAEDTNVVTVSKELAAGSYTFKLKTDDGTWYGNGGTIADTTEATSESGWDMTTSGGDTTLTASGGTYTFNFTLSTKKLVILYTAPVEETSSTAATEPTTTTAATEATDATEVTPSTGDQPATDATEATPATEATDATDTPVVETFSIDWAEASGLYAYAGTSTENMSTEAWQRWLSKTEGRVFYLPPSASDSEVIIYNTYTNDVTVNEVTIPAGGYAVVPYVEGTKYSTTGAEDQTLTIYKTDSEVSLFINTDMEKGSVVDDDAAETTYKLDAISGTWYDFLVAGSTKNREAKKLGGAVASADGIVEEQVKKIKGRGNSTWFQESKKPFNITFADVVGIDGMDAAEKWSLLANAKDDSLMRNRLVYDMANEVNMKYACDSRFVDFYVDGRYMGAYQIVQKIELGDGTVMGDLVEPEVEDVTNDDGTVTEYPKSDFDFVLELDTKENAANAGDNGEYTSLNQWMTFKIPDSPQEDQAAWMMEKYQALEDALYGDKLEELEKLVDMNDLAKAYLVNEISKNVDAGITSCYFVYNSAEGKFYASPVWDYDNALGNMGDTTRKDLEGNYLDLGSPSDWYASELAHYDSNFKGKNSLFSMACHTTSTTADGKTFADIVAEVWESDFADLVDILEGTKTDNEGRLNSVSDYMSKLAKSGQWNYDKGWTLKQNWTSDHSSLRVYDFDSTTNELTYEDKSYNSSDAVDMNQYSGDWLISRLNWMAAQYAGAETVTPDGYITVYFQNNWMWTNVSAYTFDASTDTTIGAAWPGTAMTFVANDGNYDIYSISIPADAAVIFNGTKDDNSGTDQSPDITDPVDGRCYYMKWENNANNVGYEDIEIMLPELFTSTAATEATTSTATDATEGTVASGDETVATDPTESVVTTPTESTAPAETTMTIYFQNNWLWTDVSIYYWDANGPANAWPGVAMELYGNDGTYDIYVAEVPTDITGLIVNGVKNDGSGATDQTPDITEGWYDGICYYMTWSDGNAVGSEDIDVILPTEPSEPDTTTSQPASDPATGDETVATDPTESVVTTPTESTVPAETTMTIYFQNNWLWTDVSIYYWDANGPANAWPGVAMELYGNDGTYDIYVAEVPTDITGLIVNGVKNDGSGATDQTPDITEGWYDGICYYMTWSDGNAVGSEDIDVILPTEPTEPSEPDTTTSQPTSQPASDPASGDEPETSTPVDTSVTVYVINSAKWEEVYAYAWTNDGDTTWPGVAMTATGETVNGFDVYTITYDTAYAEIIFNNNNKGSQTTDLALEDGKYYDVKSGAWYDSLADVPALDPLSTDRYLVGSFNSWNTTTHEFKLNAEGDTVGYVTLTLEANTTYEFKVIREGAWTGNETTITSSVAGLVYSSSVGGNTTLTTTDAGDYVFGFGVDDSTLSVTYPGETPATPDEPIVDNNYYIHGEFNGWEDIVLEGEGTVLSATVEITAGTYGFKLHKADTWYGNNGTIDDTCDGWTFNTGDEYGNCTLNATGGTYTFTLDTETMKLTITAVLDEIETPVYNVTWAESETYTVDAPATVDEAGTLEFTVTATEGYSIAAVIVDMQVLTADENGVYAIANVTGDVNILVIATEDKEVVVPDETKYYTVVFVDSDGTLLSTQTVKEDEAAVAPADPAKDADAQYTYIFAGWDVAYDNITADTVVTATYTSTLNKYTVTFVDYDGAELKTEEVEYGSAATAPADPTRDGYTFKGWDTEFDNVTEDITVTAKYSKVVAPVTTGTLKVDVTGGTGFALTMNDVTRPQGTTYYNSKMPIGTTVTVTANATSGATFVGWMSAYNVILSTDTSYTFVTTGSEQIKAVYDTDVEGVELVIFKNDKSNQILDMQFYASTDAIAFPADPSSSTWNFLGWTMTEAEIQAAIANGESVTVTGNWELKPEYVTVTVIGGTATGTTNAEGQFQKGVQMTVTANAAAEGESFAYWINGDGKIVSYEEEYKLFPRTDMTLKAVYASEGVELDYEVLVNINSMTEGTDRITYNYSWYTPVEQAGFTHQAAGMIFALESNYDENNFVVGADNIVTAKSSNTSSSYTTNQPKGMKSGETWYARAWVQYLDADGNLQYAYSDVVVATKG